MFPLRSRVLSGRVFPSLPNMLNITKSTSLNAPLLTLRYKSTTTTTAAADNHTIVSEEDAIHKYGQEKRPMTIDRELPNPLKDRTRNRVQFVGFWILMGVCTVLMFNYEKTNSPIVITTLHFLRRSKVIREILGDQIDFASMYPWIGGELNQVKGVVDIAFDVKGSKRQGTIKLVADRENRHHDFLIHEWSLTVDGEKVDLLEDSSVDFSV